jgi:uncharacterized protein
MGKLLVLVLLIGVAVWLLRRALRRLDGSGGVQPPKAPEELVRCAQCGLLLPRAEAREAAGRPYCTEEHARLGPGPR